MSARPRRPDSLLRLEIAQRLRRGETLTRIAYALHIPRATVERLAQPETDRKAA
jgi:plasmid maintenance system antidote protein VapI